MGAVVAQIGVIHAEAVRLLKDADANRVVRTRLSGEGEPEQQFEAVWIQVAREGAWKGHSAGTVTFDAEAFEQIVANFRSNPSYQAADDGLGVADVVAYDFHHESEKTGAHIAQSGAPAQAWAIELETRKAEDGKLELWALTRYLEPARTYVREGRYKWTSVAVWPNAKDQVTGEDVGWYLSSIAFTNDPFIQGMQPIAATRQRPVTLSQDDLLEELRYCFGLPATAGVDVLVAELTKLQAMAAGQVAPPPGVDPMDLIAKLRRMLRLPVLTGAEETLSQAMQAVAPPTDTTAMQAAHKHTESEPDTMNETLKKLAASRGWPLDEDQILDRVLAENDSFRAKLSAIFQALGMEDGDNALDELQGRMKDLQALQDMVPELAEMREDQKKAEDDAADEDVEKVAASFPQAAHFKDALLAERTGGIELDAKGDHADFRAALAKRKAKREAFLTKYQPPSPTQQHLLQPIATGAQSPGFTDPVLNAIQRPSGSPTQGPPKLDANGAKDSDARIDLSAYPGRNAIEQAMAYLAEKDPAQDFDSRHAQACVLARRFRA